MNIYKKTFASFILLLFGLVITVEPSMAYHNDASADTTSLNANGKKIPAGHKGRISLNTLDLQFSDQLSVQKIEIVTVANGQKKNHESYTKIESFNMKAASITKKIARAGDELHITMYMPNGQSNRYAIKLSK